MNERPGDLRDPEVDNLEQPGHPLVVLDHHEQVLGLQIAVNHSHGVGEIECVAHLQRYADNGVTVPVSFLLPIGTDLPEAARRLAPPTPGLVRSADWD